jgi:hypothetical protein
MPPAGFNYDLRCFRRATMKKLLALTLVVMVAGGALAQTSEDNMMGMFFAQPFVDENTNFDPDGSAPFDAFTVLLNPTVETVGGYEVGVAVSDPSFFVLSLDGPNGWTNFGGNLNHLVGYQTPLPVVDGGTVLCTFQVLYSGSDVVTIAFGPAVPPSIPGVPVIANGANPDELIACNLTSDGGYVATLNGDGVVATEAHSLSGVKALFD